MTEKKDTMDIIIPVYNEELCIDELCRRLINIKQSNEFLEISFIFVDDGSKDSSLEKLSLYAQENKYFKVISFSRNFGHQIAITAAIDNTDADFVAIIDADLQDPPELIIDMYKKAKEGFDIVYGTRKEREGEKLFKKTTAVIFYKFINKMCNVSIPEDTGDFRLISKRVVSALKNMREKHRFIRGMVPWIGFNSVPFFYNREKRYQGETKYPFSKMLRFALDGIFSFSNVPLRMAMYLGTVIIFIGLSGIMLILYLRLFTNYYVSGITTVIVSVLVMGGFQIFMTGMVGEYIGRIFEEIKGRPLYIIKESKNFNVHE